MRRFKILFAIFVIILGGIFFFWNDILDFYLELSLKLPQVEKEIGDFLIKEPEKQISTPSPLRSRQDYPEAFLTGEGVIYWTNIQREKYGFAPLRENRKLNASAQAKLQDMFKNQYFSHLSPSGVGVGDLTESAGYEFIAIGENLAFGNFKDDEELVQGWMDSPGHRVNILSSIYEEIGAGVGKGIFEGKSTWMVVQHFGLPFSACPQPDEALREEIEVNQNQIQELQETLEMLKTEIQAIKPKKGRVFQQKIKRYNTLVSQYNTLVKETETLINEYNTTVRLFNECAIGGK